MIEARTGFGNRLLTSKVNGNKPPELYLPTQAAKRDEHIRLPEARLHIAADHQPATIGIASPSGRTT